MVQIILQTIEIPRLQSSDKVTSPVLRIVHVPQVQVLRRHSCSHSCRSLSKSVMIPEGVGMPVGVPNMWQLIDGDGLTGRFFGAVCTGTRPGRSCPQGHTHKGPRASLPFLCVWTNTRVKCHGEQNHHLAHGWVPFDVESVRRLWRWSMAEMAEKAERERYSL